MKKDFSVRPCSFLVSLCLSCACVIGVPAGAQTYHIIALPDGTSPTGINESGDATGYPLDSNQAFVSEPSGKAEVIPGTPATSIGFGIAGAGPKGSWPEEEDKRKLRITGSAVFNPNSGVIFFPFYQAFLYEDHFLRDLGTLPGGSNSAGMSVNSSGEVAGYSDALAVVFKHGNIITLGTLKGDSGSSASGINNLGDVTGVSYASGPLYLEHAFLYSDGHMKDLNDMIPSNSGWELNTATGINNRGEITGTGTFNGVNRGFILTLDCNDISNRDCDSCRRNR